MFYIVECSYLDQKSEADWNSFYSLNKLPALISVSGFQTSQRFKALTPGCPVYLAIHTIKNHDVLNSHEYRQKGGGNFSYWQQHISDWHRNLYSCIDKAPAVTENQIMILCLWRLDYLETELGYVAYEMTAVGLEKFPAKRWLYVLTRDDEEIVSGNPEGLHVYEPMTQQLLKSSDCE